MLLNVKCMCSCLSIIELKNARWNIEIPYLLYHVSCCYSDIRHNLYVVYIDADVTVVYKNRVSVNLEENHKGDQITVAVTLCEIKVLSVIRWKLYYDR